MKTRACIKYQQHQILITHGRLIYYDDIKICNEKTFVYFANHITTPIEEYNDYNINPI